MRRRIAVAIAALVATIAAASSHATLPSGWTIVPPPSVATATDTMPQGAAPSPDGTTLAVVDSGFDKPSLRLYRTNDLQEIASIPLAGAFGRPLWLGADRILVAGANADAVFDVDVRTQNPRKVPLSKDSYPVAIARVGGDLLAVGTDGDACVRIGTLEQLATAKAVKIGGHIGGLAVSAGGATLFVSNRARSQVTAIDVASGAKRTIATGLHPSALMVAGSTLYVAESDAGTVGAYEIASGRRIAQIAVGPSPNNLTLAGDSLYVSVGAGNDVAVIRKNQLAGRFAAGWYPTDAVVAGKYLFAIDGKGEGSTPNPHFKSNGGSDWEYIGTLELGSIRRYDVSAMGAGNAQGSTGWQAASPVDTVVRAHGPIQHVFFVLKENRTYDQVLGDVAGANGDPKLAAYGKRVTPNQHALARRFGVFDNAYTNGEVSEAGHLWSDAAFANDFIERDWPMTYGGRGNPDPDQEASGASIPRNGYIWQAARRSGVSFRDYGEMLGVPSLKGLYDPKYVGWDLNYSDLDRAREWKREFYGFVRAGNLPQLEWIYFPDDHTAHLKPGSLTPSAYVARNDWAVGRLVETISHSPVWKSSAIFVIEDDSQDGPDHVSDQRTTMYVVSPYSKGGVIHEHYSTASVLRTIELMLGIEPLSDYDAKAVPLYAAFAATPDLRGFDALPPQIDLRATNPHKAKVGFVPDLSRPDVMVHR